MTRKQQFKEGMFLCPSRLLTKEASLLQGTQPAICNLSDLFFSITCVNRYLCLHSINVFKRVSAVYSALKTIYPLLRQFGKAKKKAKPTKAKKGKPKKGADKMWRGSR